MISFFFSGDLIKSRGCMKILQRFLQKFLGYSSIYFPRKLSSFPEREYHRCFYESSKKFVKTFLHKFLQGILQKNVNVLQKFLRKILKDFFKNYLQNSSENFSMNSLNNFTRRLPWIQVFLQECLQKLHMELF